MSDLGYLHRQPDDDPVFLATAEHLIDGVDGRLGVLVVVRVRGWFDQKWLRFSGRGRVPFEHFRLSHPGVALEPFWQDQLTFPPFTPARIVDETHFGPVESVESAAPELIKRIHRRRRRESATNLHRRVKDHHPTLIAAWVSTGSDAHGRGSVMVYSSQGGVVDAWYAGFVRTDGRWCADRVKGIARRDVVRSLGEDLAPRSGVVLA